jgi:hypothetical protein
VTSTSTFTSSLTSTVLPATRTTVIPASDCFKYADPGDARHSKSHRRQFVVPSDAMPAFRAQSKCLPATGDSISWSCAETEKKPLLYIWIVILEGSPLIFCVSDVAEIGRNRQNNSVNVAEIANSMRFIQDDPSQGPGLTSNLPYRSASFGKTSRVRRVEVTSPLRIAIAIRPFISRLGSPPPIANGRRPSPVTNVFIRIGVGRSEAPRSAVSSPRASPRSQPNVHNVKSAR